MNGCEVIVGVIAGIGFIQMSVIFIFRVARLCGRSARCLATAAVCTAGLIGSCSTATISCTTFTLCSSTLSFPSLSFSYQVLLFSYPFLSFSYPFLLFSYLSLQLLLRPLFFWSMTGPTAISTKLLLSSTFQLTSSRYRLHFPLASYWAFA